MDKNILIVDDEQGSLEVMCRVVEHAGYTIHCASTASEAFELFDAIDPFLVIADLRLKDNHVDGATVADRLHRKSPLCIFICVSGYIDPDAFELGYLLGAVFTDVLTKPFSPEDLIRIVDYAWEKRQRWETILTA